MSDDKLAKRLEGMFTPHAPRPDPLEPEVNALRERIAALEAALAAAQAETAQAHAEVAALRQAPAVPNEPEPTLPPPTLSAERDRFSASFEEVAIPASDATTPFILPIANGDLAGLLQVDLPANDAPTADAAGLVKDVAQRLVQQVENLRLLADAERARAEAERATRRLAREGWQTYLNAIDRPEVIGYTYDQTTVAPFTAMTADQPAVSTPLTVTGEAVGSLHVHSAASEWTPNKQRIMEAVARQVAQQVENLRLLADAGRARAEAEAATRRLTREAWQTYLAEAERNQIGFTYDQQRVTPLTQPETRNGATLTAPLRVGNEAIGQLSVASSTATPEAHALLEIVAARLSAHLESLRLLEETERGRQQLNKRAVELQTVARVSVTASTTLDVENLLQSVVDLTQTSFGLYHAHIYLLEEEAQTLVLTAGAGEIGHQMVEEGHSLALNSERSLIARVARAREGLIANQARLSAEYRPHPLLPNVQAELAVPLIASNVVLGVLAVQAERENYFTADDVNIMTTLAGQVAVALQNARSYADQAVTVARLRELDHLKSSFLANMSHELRTPLNSILGFTEVILEGLDGDLTPNMENDLKIVYKNGQHLLNLINDILDMAKIESGKMILHLERFNFVEMLEDVVSITSPLASEKSLSLFLDPESDPNLELDGDRTRLRQVMINLVNNALKFTETGKVVLKGERDEARQMYVITVKDTGLGIPASHLESVFQEFTQVDTSTTRKAGGTGLGLPISRRLAEMHGGKLWAESTGVPGEGSTFFLELPMRLPSNLGLDTNESGDD